VLFVNSEVKLSPPDVQHKFQLLARYSGGDPERHILKEIVWMEREFFAT
jgi:methylase of polypeptide subunit release factors